MSEYWLKFGLIMFLMMFVDMCWAKYTLATQEKNPLAAGNWSVGIMLCGSFVTVNYVSDKTYIIAAALGAFIGTYLTVLHSRRKADNSIS
jgi:glycerol uptake facilitator-like aquaporin